MTHHGLPHLSDRTLAVFDRSRPAQNTADPVPVLEVKCAEAGLRSRRYRPVYQRRLTTIEYQTC